MIVTQCYNYVKSLCKKNQEGSIMELVGLKKARSKKGLSQLKVAMDLSITREALSYYENGKRSPDVDMLVKLARYFGVSVDYIIFGED